MKKQKSKPIKEAATKSKTKQYNQNHGRPLFVRASGTIIHTYIYHNILRRCIVFFELFKTKTLDRSLSSFVSLFVEYAAELSDKLKTVNTQLVSKTSEA